MPCTYVESPEELAASHKARQDKLKGELDKVTRLLCTVMTDWKEDNRRMDADHDAIVSHLPTKIQNNTELQKWWKEHQRVDKEREKNEKESLIKSAKSKLTKEELQAILDRKK